MDAVLVNRAHLSSSSTSSASRLLIAIAGVPAGKTSFATGDLVHKVNALLRAHPSEAQAILVGLDGWHLTRAQLDSMGDRDPKRAHPGNHWTFDPPAYVNFVTRLRRDPRGRLCTFDRALKDPTPDAVVIRPSHRIVVIERLYTMLDVDPWHRAAALMGERWWIRIGPVRARTRLVKWHVQPGVAKDMDEGCLAR